MAKKPVVTEDERYRDDEALERMNKALKKAMETKPTPHKEMVKGGSAKRGKRPKP